MQRHRYLVISVAITAVTFGILALIYWGQQASGQVFLRGGFLGEPIEERGTQTLIPAEYILNTGLRTEHVPPISNPSFTSVIGADSLMSNYTVGISIEIDGEMRFYPTQILNHHYVVLDEDSKGPFVVTYCTFCNSGVVYRTDRKLRVSSYQYNNNILLEDADGNLWHQLTGLAVQGPATGEVLARQDNINMITWGTWKRANPNGRVLSRKTGYERDYGRHPFGAYDANDTVYYPLSYVDERLPKKSLVNGALIGEQPVAFAHKPFEKAVVGQGEVAGTPYVAFYSSGPEVRAFSPVVNGETLTFKYNARSRSITDEKTGSEWNALGRSTKGELAGTQLDRYSTTQAMFMCWMGTYPDSTLPEVPDIKIQESN